MHPVNRQIANIIKNIGVKGGGKNGQLLKLNLIIKSKKKKDFYYNIIKL